MPNSLRRVVAVLPLALLLAACGNEQDDQLGAEPADTVAPAPTDTTLVPGADIPGAQEEP